MKPRKAVYLLVDSPALKRAKECLTRNQPWDYEGKLMKIVSWGNGCVTMKASHAMPSGFD
ncbi:MULTISPECIES: hypothetical protein [Vibrio]|uniref:hypothetical protein n=1 Tax=Vibrio TaxID=662 RepID=UPI001A215692|nr:MULTISPECIES: hypothetical protein [Vibrio]EGQ7904791.1 hypothetical protein [Vibrio alginolyticus]EIK0773935.1 hypothetical protein [Vibrio alginolyticus]MBS9820133.1 hypothetical protein [Vibrio alginolyticus]MBS9967523.1 hypothetical protein [Vibrio alginolyticus]MBT0017432.1 hypothetical protein [Vibrio alginolyticus]